MPAAAPSDPLSLSLAALADPTRRAMLRHLARAGDVSVSDLAAPFAISQPAVSKHIKVLERAGLIRRSRTAQFRPCRLEPSALAPVLDWIEQLRVETEAQMDRLEAYLQELQAAAQAAVPGNAVPGNAVPQSTDITQSKETP